MKKLLFIFTMLIPMFAFALDLAGARSSKLIAENDHGYIVALSDSSEVKQLVDEVNSKRRAEYQKIANQTATSITEVEHVSAQKIFNSIPNGTKIITNGQVSEK